MPVHPIQSTRAPDTFEDTQSVAPAPAAAPEATSTVVPRQSTPTVTLVAAGGCGINLCRQIQASSVNTLIDSRVWLDTSGQNLRHGETAHLLSSAGVGGGKNQNLNFNEILRSYSQFRDMPDTDVYLVTFGMSGASGSVIGTVVATELMSRGKRVVIAMVADTSSEIDNANTENTLNSLVARTQSQYAPVILAYNANGNRAESDAYLLQQLTDLIRLLKLPTVEVDCTDRLHFLNPAKTVRVSNGLHLLYVDSDTAKIPANSGLGDPSQICDSVLNLGLQEDGQERQITGIGELALFRKVGLLSGDAQTTSPLVGMVVNNTQPIEELKTVIKETSSMYAAQESQTQATLVADTTKTDQNGYGFGRPRV